MYVGAVDQGTTGTRFVAFDREGRPVAEGYERHEQQYPEPGWVEHDPAELIKNTRTAMHDALADAGIGGEELAALGVANQRETTVLWESATGDPVASAIVWQDRRTTERVEGLSDRAAEIRERRALSRTRTSRRRNWSGSSTGRTAAPGPSGANCSRAPSTRGSSTVWPASTSPT